METYGDKNVTMWRRERAHTSDNQANYVATVYWNNDGSFGVAWLREPENQRWIERKRYR